MPKSPGNCDGFTLIDLLLTLSVLGLLMGAVFRFGISGFNISERMQMGFSNETAAGRIMREIAYGYPQGGKRYPGITEAAAPSFSDGGAEISFGVAEAGEQIIYRKTGSVLHRYLMKNGSVLKDEILSENVGSFGIYRTAKDKLLRVSLALKGTAKGYQGTNATQYIALRN